MFSLWGRRFSDDQLFAENGNRGKVCVGTSGLWAKCILNFKVQNFSMGTLKLILLVRINQKLYFS